MIKYLLITLLLTIPLHSPVQALELLQSPLEITTPKDSIDYFYPRSTESGRYMVVVTKDRNVLYVDCPNDNCLKPYVMLEDLFGKKGY